MKHIVITKEDGSVESIQCIAEETSDGYHTFNELYEHRCLLFIGLMNSHQALSWFSRKHHDGSEWEGWIIGGMNLSTGSITYHIPSRLSHLIRGKELELAPEWDGHTSEEVLKRIESWARTV